MDFRILGPLEVRANGDRLALGGPKQRALLAILLLNADRVVSRDRLIEELWANDPPAAARHALDVNVSRLRKALGANSAGGSLLVTRSPGYMLCIEPGELDLRRFERLVEDGRRAFEAGDAERAARALREAQDLWRGRPLADLEFEPFARVDVERLEELHLVAIEECIEAELALGRHRPLVVGARSARRRASAARAAARAVDAGVVSLRAAGRRARGATAARGRCWSSRSASSRGRSCARCTKRSCGRTRPSTRRRRLSCRRSSRGSRRWSAATPSWSACATLGSGRAAGGAVSPW